MQDNFQSLQISPHRFSQKTVSNVRNSKMSVFDQNERRISKQRVSQERKNIDSVVMNTESVQSLQSLNRLRLRTISKIAQTKIKHKHPLLIEDFELYEPEENLVLTEPLKLNTHSSEETIDLKKKLKQIEQQRIMRVRLKLQNQKKKL